MMPLDYRCQNPTQGKTEKKKKIIYNLQVQPPWEIIEFPSLKLPVPQTNLGIDS